MKSQTTCIGWVARGSAPIMAELDRSGLQAEKAAITTLIRFQGQCGIQTFEDAGGPRSSGLALNSMNREQDFPDGRCVAPSG